MNLKKTYCHYLEHQVSGSIFEEDLCTGKYLCWSIPHQETYQIYNWLGELTENSTAQTKRYVWLGNKGAIYVTKSPKFEKTQSGDIGIVLALKRAQQ